LIVPAALVIRLGVVLQPLVGAQREHHVVQGQRAVLHRDAGVLGLRAFAVDRLEGHARELGRGRRPVVDRRHLGAPPGAGPGQRGGVVARTEDALAMAAGAQAGVQVDPGQPAAARRVLLQHVAPGDMAPAGVAAGEEQALGLVVLAAADGGLQRHRAVLGDEGGDDLFVLGRRRPVRRHDGMGQFGVAGVDGQRLAEVDEIAVQVDVLLRRAPPPAEAPGVQRVHVQHRHAGRGCRGVERRRAQQRHLHARPAEALQAVAAAGDDQQPLRVGGAEARHVDGQFLAVAADQRVAVGVGIEPGRVHRGQEQAARLRVGLREAGVDVHHRAACSATSRPAAPRRCRPAGSGRR
jgi:hypothetical protein